MVVRRKRRCTKGCRGWSLTPLMPLFFRGDANPRTLRSVARLTEIVSSRGIEPTTLERLVVLRVSWRRGWRIESAGQGRRGLHA